MYRYVLLLKPSEIVADARGKPLVMSACKRDILTSASNRVDLLEMFTLITRDIHVAATKSAKINY